MYESDLHNHADDSDIIKGERFRVTVKDAVRVDPCRPVKRAYDTVVVDLRRPGS